MLPWTRWCCHHPWTQHVVCCPSTALQSLGTPRTLALSISPKRLMIDDTLTTLDGAPAAREGSSSRVSR